MDAKSIIAKFNETLHDLNACIAQITGDEREHYKAMREGAIQTITRFGYEVTKDWDKDASVWTYRIASE